MRIKIKFSVGCSATRNFWTISIEIHFSEHEKFFCTHHWNKQFFYCFFWKIKCVNFYDLQLFNPLIGGYMWYRIEMLIVQRPTETQITLFQLCDRGAIPLLGGENDKKPHFFSKMTSLWEHLAPHPSELGSQNFVWWVFNSKLTHYVSLVGIRAMFFFIHPNGLTIQKLQFNWQWMQLLQVAWDNLR